MTQRRRTTKTTPNKAKKTAKVTLPRGIRQRESGRFIIDLTVNGVRRTATANTVEEAIEKRLAMLGEAKEGQQAGQTSLTINNSWTLREGFNRTIAAVWSGTSSEKTARINSQAAMNFFGEEMPLVDITVDSIDNYVQHLMERGDADATINRKISALRSIMKTAYERGQIPLVPKMPRRKEKVGRIRFLTIKEEEEVLKWFKHFDKMDHHEATVILLDTGFRTGELWRVTAQHIDFIQGTFGTITLWRTKNGKARTVPMTFRVREIITRRVREYPSGPLFPDATKDWYRCGWDRVRTLMNMENDPEFVPHCLRHTCCSRLVQRGVPLIHVQQWMGHNAIQTTMRYAHLAPHDLFMAAAVLEGGETARWEAQPTVTEQTPRKKTRRNPLLQ